MNRNIQSIIFYDNLGWPLKSRLLLALAKGAEKLGFKVKLRNPQPYASGQEVAGAAAVVVFGYGEKSRLIRDDYSRHNIPVIFIENGFLRRGEYWQIGLYGICQYADFRNSEMPDDRFKKLNIPIEPMTFSEDGYILILGQVPGDSQLGGINPVRWAIDTAKKYKDEEVWFRPHPNAPHTAEDVRRAGINVDQESGFRDICQGAKAVVTINSNAGHEALLMGFPVICEDIAMYKDIAFRNLDEVKKLKKWRLKDHDAYNEKRKQYFADLAYAQWTISEMEQGKPLKHLLGIEQKKQRGRPRKGNK